MTENLDKILQRANIISGTFFFFGLRCFFFFFFRIYSPLVLEAPAVVVPMTSRGLISLLVFAPEAEADPIGRLWVHDKFDGGC